MRSMWSFFAIAFMIIGVGTGTLEIGTAIAQDAAQAEQKPTEPAGTQADEAAKQTEKNVQAAADRLVSAMDQLIPGDFAPDSPARVQLKEPALTLIRGDVKAASEQLQKLVQENPAFPPALLLLAAMHFSLGQTDAGHLALERAAVEFPEYPGVYTALARVSINQSWWASSMALLQQLRQKLDAGTWTEDQKKHFELEYLDALADTSIGQQRWDEARQHLAELQTRLPENASAPFRLADIDFRQEKFDSALENLAKARRLDSNLYPPELVLYQWFGRQNKPEEAARWIKTASEKFADEKSVQMEYGRFLLEQGTLTEAALWIAKAEKSGANATLTRFMQGQVAFMRRSYSVAEATFNELSLQNPNDVGIRNMLALSLIESEDPNKRQKALEIASANLRFNPNNTQLASSMAWVLYQLGNVQQAKQIFSQVTGLPNFPSDTAYFVAQLFIDEGQYESAGKLLNEALKARGLFLYRLRAEADLAEVNKRLADQPKTDTPTRPESSGDKR